MLYTLIFYEIYTEYNITEEWNSRMIICVGTPALSTPCPGSLNPMKAVEEIIEGTERAKKKKSQKGRGRSGSQSGPCRFTYFNGSSCTSSPRKVCPSFFVLILFFFFFFLCALTWLPFKGECVMKIIFHNILYISFTSILRYMLLQMTKISRKTIGKTILRIETLDLEKY